ncbi:hypothetical protein [Campylobacter jejuni]|uniref:hypothetical protein n=1 Tax=Campylobacter jejuni TaxID=197 RepID=UPI000F8049DB|nr:hypothetical protein [Campylobacter jejuni]RTJ90018.1 hypothetical protein C3H46_01285 [Campylobacter jejuni]HAA1509528.1 hypothetical protein [Campylobacter jejuni]
MDILEITESEYHNFDLTFSYFDLVSFINYNKYKVNDVKYFLFKNNKNRFIISCGIKENDMLFPFSAPFSCLINISKDNKMLYYHEAIKLIIKWANENCKKNIYFNTPPLFYNYSHITKLQNALISNNFSINDYDVNYEIYLKNIDKSRNNLRSNFENNLSLIKSNNLQIAYDIIKENRESKNYNLNMAIEDVEQTSKIIPTDLFLVYKDDIPIASAIVHIMSQNIARVVYWGNTTNSNKYRPMNFLSYNLFLYYKNQNFKIVDIGTSTLHTTPNFGLCDYKESIGCDCSPKINFIYQV